MAMASASEWEGWADQYGGASGWAAQQLRLPVWWYASIEAGSGAEFPVSGDGTMEAHDCPFGHEDPLGCSPTSEFFAQLRIAHGSRPLPLRA